MTLEELLKKNALIEAARQEKQKVNVKVKKVVVNEQPVEECKREDEEAVVEKKTKGKKPANREYMVIEENYNNAVKEEAAEEAKEDNVEFKEEDF